METTMTSKGQVTIPKAVREGAGLRPGDPVEVVLENGHAVVHAISEVRARERRREEMRARIAAYHAKYPPLDVGGMTTEAIMAEVREPVPL